MPKKLGESQNTMSKIKKKEAVKKLQKLGFTPDEIEKIQGALGEDDSEIDDVDLLTETEARMKLDGDFKKKYEASGKATAWNFIDENHKKYEALLTDEARAVYNSKSNTHEKNDFLLEYLQSRGVQSGDSAAYKKSYTELQAKIASDYVEKAKYEEIQNKLTPAQKRALNAELIMEATRNQKISDTLKSDRRFKANFLADFEESVQNKGYTIDFETGQLKDKDGVSVLGKDNNPLTATGYIDSVLDEYPDWTKKSEGQPVSTTVTVPVVATQKVSSSVSKNLAEALV